MRFSDYLQEEYVTTIKSFKLPCKDDCSSEVFRNPSPEELRSINSSYGLRFAIDYKHKNVYVWAADYIHYVAVNIIRKDVSNFTSDNQGTGTYKSGKIGIENMDYKFSSNDWNWLSHYFIKDKHYLQEEYLLTAKGFNRDATTIFVNPDKKELAEITRVKNEVRFIIDLEDKKLYVWHAYDQIHLPVATEIGFGEDIYNNKRFIFGNAQYLNGHLDNLTNIYKIRKNNYSFNWLNTYFSKTAVISMKDRTVPRFSENE